MYASNLDSENEIFCFLPDQLNTSDFSPAEEVLVVISKWLEQLKITNIAELTFGELASSLIEKSSVLPVLQCIYDKFFKCCRFPHHESVVNEWFDLPGDERTRNQRVRAINIEKEARTSWKGSTIINQLKLDELQLSWEDDNFEILFHGTNHESAEAIKDGIDLRKGGRGLEFSHRDGFYVFKDSFEATCWAASNFTYRDSAVFVFQVRKSELRGDDNEKGYNLTGNDKKREWKELVRTFRSAKPSKKFLKTLSGYDFIEGPVATYGRKSFENYPTPKEGSYQLCVRSFECAELFNRSLYAVVYINVAS